MRVFRIGAAVAVVAALGVIQAAPAEAALTSQEFKCSATLAKSFSKLHATILKTKGKCHSDDISGKADSTDQCETLSVDATAKIDKAKAKTVSKIAKACASVCSTTDDMACIDHLGCPARHQAAPVPNPLAERCTGKGGANPFGILNLGWPGPYCEDVLGHPLQSVSDLGDCVNSLAETTADAIDETVYADLDESDTLSGDAAKCLSSISKSVTKALGTAYVKTAACRDARFSANDSNLLPFACATQDEDSIAAIAKAIDGVEGAVDKACNDATIAELTGLCATGGETPVTALAAKSCLTDAVTEVAVGERSYNRHVYSPFSMMNITHPDSATAYCGDGRITATRQERTGVGEECDGENDAACGAGSCLPVGDVFECTCDTTPRERFIVDGDESATDSDAGWLGSSHDATHNDGFGYVNDMTNCTCDSFTQATCTAPSGDDICDMHSNMAPRCSDDMNGTDTCDSRGNGDDLHSDFDCFRCDDYSINAGDWCSTSSGATNEVACNSQCIVDATNVPAMPVAPCTQQSDCPTGQSCRGRCDNTLTCNKMTEGSPLAIISADTPVCITLEFLSDIVGTKNTVTGESALDYTTRSIISLGEVARTPCPTCGGICVGGANNGDACEGRCNVSNDECIFDSDCTAPGDTTCVETADDCTGGTCSLDLRCSSGATPHALCRPDSVTSFGVTSDDCRPVIQSGFAAQGVRQAFGNVTTEAVQFPVGGPCTDPSWTNFNCPCPADTPPNSGVPTKPNSCSAACDGGVNEGKGCATGDGGSGVYTTCVGGGDAGKPCDANADCDSNSCTGQPLECTAGPTIELGSSCATNADCGMGGLCEDPCPGARCVPLCMPEGRCNGGARDGDYCSTLDHCKQCTAGNPALIGTACDTHGRCNSTPFISDGVCAASPGVTCDVTDPEDGLCAAGPTKFRCTGAGFTTVSCSLNYGLCQSGFCSRGSVSQLDTACTVNGDCLDSPNVPVSSGCETGYDTRPGSTDDVPGAGECEPRPQDCYVNNGFAEGGDTLNGDGSPSEVNVNATFCTPANPNAAVNSASGFGGPSRVRRQGIAIVNVPSIP